MDQFLDDVTAVFDGELIDAVSIDLDAECSWPGCTHPWQIALPNLEGYWCFTHMNNDFLPDLITGAMGVCAKCGDPTVTWALLEAEIVPLHDRCLRAWAWTQVHGERKGAYARRT